MSISGTQVDDPPKGLPITPNLVNESIRIWPLAIFDIRRGGIVQARRSKEHWSKRVMNLVDGLRWFSCTH
jgi:hypothetical protein